LSETAPRMSRRRAAAALTGSNTLVYGLTGVFSAFMPVYLSAHHTSIVKGYLLSIGCVVALFAPVVIGKLADKAASKSRVLAGAVALSAVFFAATYLSANVWFLAATIACFSFFKASFGGMVDTVTLEYTSEHDINYGPIRMMGTVGYGALAFLLGIVANRRLGYVFASYPILAAAAIFFLLWGPQVPGHAEKREKLQVAPILKSRNIRILFLLNGVVYFCHTYYQHFYNEYAIGILHMPTWVWGLNALATVAVEIPFFFLFERIMRAVRMKSLLLTCMIVSVLRFLLLPMLSTSGGILLTAVLTGSWVTFVTYSATLYMQRNLPPNLIASGIGLLYALSCGMGNFLADFGGGYLTAWLGIRGGLFFCAGVCLLALPSVFFLRVPSPER